MIIQGATQTDLQGLSALLEVIGSPEKAKARLNELLSVSEQARADEQASVDAEGRAQKVVDAAASIEKKQNDREVRLNVKDRQVKEDRDVLAQEVSDFREKQVLFDTAQAAAVAALAEKERAFNARADKLATSLIQRETEVKKREEAASNLVEEYTSKLAAMKQLVG